MDVKNWTLAAVCAVLLMGCGSSKDKAEELVKTSGLDQQYKMILDVAASGYSSRYPMLEREQIKNVVRENLPLETLKDAMVKIYADHFDSDELELMIQASQHPDRAMAMILGSKDGQALALKTVEVQKAMMKDMSEAMEDSDEDIVDALDDLKDEAKG